MVTKRIKTLKQKKNKIAAEKKDLTTKIETV